MRKKLRPYTTEERGSQVDVPWSWSYEGVRHCLDTVDWHCHLDTAAGVFYGSYDEALYLGGVLFVHLSAWGLHLGKVMDLCGAVSSGESLERWSLAYIVYV